MDLLPLLKDYLSRVGVKFDIQPMEYAAFLSVMTTRTHSAGYMMGSGHTNPTTTLRKSFKTGQTWNPSQYSNPDVDRRIDEFHRLRDEAQRIEMVRELTVDMLDEAPYLWLPTQYVYTAWWPWVKNYGGELRAGAVRPGPIYARIWIDQDLKRELGF
ncbi:MAG: ABC transporter substrate-binding protein, partial [Gammaproteobacteria bacterium]|nr:ABC transporter substrate-binding protein [Gammaproteobacteria bacterium]